MVSKFGGEYLEANQEDDFLWHGIVFCCAPFSSICDFMPSCGLKKNPGHNTVLWNNLVHLQLLMQTSTTAKTGFGDKKILCMVLKRQNDINLKNSNAANIHKRVDKALSYLNLFKSTWSFHLRDTLDWHTWSSQVGALESSLNQLALLSWNPEQTRQQGEKSQHPFKTLKLFFFHLKMCFHEWVDYWPP